MKGAFDIINFHITILENDLLVGMQSIVDYHNLILESTLKFVQLYVVTIFDDQELVLFLARGK